MKIFIVQENPSLKGNPYLYTLIEEVKKQHPDCVISWGRDMFWSDDVFTYDIVHFHWPQAFMAGDKHTEKDLAIHIQAMKRHGVVIMATCHDLEPHYNQCSEYANSFNIVYSQSDVIMHLGEYSKHLFEEKYPKAFNCVLPHHLYDTIYKTIPSKDESTKYLHLPPNKTIILCFGTFRSDEERNLIINLSKSLNDSNYLFLAPGFMDVNYPKKSYVGIKQRIKKLFYQFKYGIYCKGKTFAPVSNEDVPYYYGAADIAFVPRVKILNSGNAVLPMLFGKIVVGPDTGNVGLLLKKWGYPVFDISNLSIIKLSVLNGLEMAKQGFASTRLKEQLDEYSTQRISEQLYNYYYYYINKIK